MSNHNSLHNVYNARESFIVIGLTGRTGSGCSTVANILSNDLDNISLREAKTSDYHDDEERKYQIIYDYITKNNRWISFTVIEMSSIILTMALEKGCDSLIAYLDKLQEEKNSTVLSISDYKNLKTILADNYQAIFTDAKKHDLSNIDITEMAIVDDYYEYYTKTLIKHKKSLKDVFSNFLCSEIQKPKMDGRKQTKLHLYTFLLQQIGNNIRASGDPYLHDFSEDKSFVFLDHVKTLIEIIKAYDHHHGRNTTRICIDAIRNPFEAFYFRDIYRAFYLLSVNTDDADRVGRLSNLSKEEREKLDEIEYPEQMKSPQEVYFHQNIHLPHLHISFLIC
jgi:dCMP deaminase